MLNKYSCQSFSESRQKIVCTKFPSARESLSSAQETQETAAFFKSEGRLFPLALPPTSYVYKPQIRFG